MHESISTRPTRRECGHLHQRAVLSAGSAGAGGESSGEGVEDVGRVAAKMLDLLGAGWVVICRVWVWVYI